MLKLERFSEGVWFDHPSGARFKVRPVMPKDYFDLRESVRQKIAIRNLKGEQEIIDDYSESKLNFRIFCHAIQEWENVTVNGAEKPSRDQVLEAIFNDSELRDWIADKAKTALEQLQEGLDQELKNSESSRAGHPSSES